MEAFLLGDIVNFTMQKAIKEFVGGIIKDFLDNTVLGKAQE